LPELCIRKKHAEKKLVNTARERAHVDVEFSRLDLCGYTGITFFRGDNAAIPEHLRYLKGNLILLGIAAGIDLHHRGFDGHFGHVGLCRRLRRKDRARKKIARRERK